MDFDSFIRKATALAKEAVSSSQPDDIGYLSSLTSLIGDVDDIPIAPSHGPIIKKEGDGWNWSTAINSMPIYGIQLNIRSGASLPLHNHEGYIGLIYLLEGKVEVKSYSHESSLGDELLLRLHSEDTLRPGDSAIVPLKYGNIHTLRDVAGGSTLLDILTIFTGNGESYSIQITGQEGELYRASHTGTRI